MPAKLLVEKNFTSIMEGNNYNEKTVIPTQLFLSNIIQAGMNQLGRPTMSCFLPNNCKGILMGRERTIYIMEFPPEFHKITLDSTLSYIRDQMLEKFRDNYPQVKTKRKNSFKLLFPYVIFQIVFGPSHSRNLVHVFLSNSPISSFESPIQLMPFPNIYNNQSVCMPEDHSLYYCENQVEACNKLVNNFWVSVYNNDLTYNLENTSNRSRRANSIHTNYYIWEYESINNPAKVLGHEFSPKFSLLKYTKSFLYADSSIDLTANKLSDNIFNSFTGETTVGSIDRLREINRKHDVTYNGIEKCITFSNDDDHITINLQDEFVMNKIRYILVNIISIGGGSDNYKKSILELVPKGNHSIIYRIELNKINKDMVDDIITNKLKEKNLIVTKFKYNNKIISEGDKLIGINKFNHNAIFFTFKEKVNNIAGNYVLKSSLDKRYSNSMYDFYLEKDIKGYVVDGITLRKNKKLTIYEKRNNLCFEERNSFVVDDSTIIFERGRIQINNSVICNFDKIENNYMFLSLDNSFALVDYVSLSHKININFIVQDSFLIAGEFTTLAPAGRKTIIINLDNNQITYDNFNEVSNKLDNLVYYMSRETKLRSLNKGELIVVPKWTSFYNLSLLYCVIDGFEISENEISIILTTCKDKTKFSLPITDDVGLSKKLFNGCLIRTATLECDGFNVGDYIEKTSSTRFIGLTMSKSYKIEGIITDCYRDDKLIVLSNNQTLWLKTVKEHFKNVGSEPSKSECNIKTSLDDAFNDGRPQTFKTIKKFQNNEYGIPSPRIFNNQTVEENFIKFYN